MCKSLICCAFLALSLPGFGRAPHDDRFRESVHLALANRLSVRSARLKVEEARKLRSASSAFPLTRLETGISTRPDVTGGEDLTLFQPLDVFGKLKAVRASGDAVVASSLAVYRQTMLDVQDETLTAFSQYANARRLLDSSQVQLKLAQAVRDATAKRVEARSIPELQLVRADLDLERAQQLVTDRAAAVAVALTRLSGAIGADVAASDGEVGELDQSVLSAEDLAKTRPDLMALMSEVDSAKADGRQAKLSLFPDLEIQARRAPWSSDEQYGARVQLVFPLWDHGAAREKGRAARHHAEAATLLFQDKLRSARKEVEAAETELAAAERSLLSYQRLVDGATRLLSKTQRSFELGASTLIDVLDAKRALSDAQETWISAQLRKDLAIASLLKAQGSLLEEPK